MDLRPLSYEEMCQMELLHGGSSGVGAAAVGGSMSANQAPSAGVAGASTATTMMPIMVIPSGMMPPGTILAAATPSNIDLNGSNGCEHQFYQLQPTHILAAPTTASTANIIASGSTAGGCASLAGQAAQLNSSYLPVQHPLLLASGSNNGNLVGGVGVATFTPNTTNTEQFPQQQPPPQQQQQQQQPQTQQQLPHEATVNILYTGTLQKPRTTIAPLTRKVLESATLPRGFQAPTYFNATNGTSVDESDFEGSECGASVSGTTCIPHFRFGGCGMILQQQQQQQPPTSHHATTQTMQQQQQQQQQHYHDQNHNQNQEPQVIGCGALSHMMGSFAAAAAGGALHTTGRLVGFSGTLSRNRSRHDGAIAQTPKRVSFKGDNLPPPSPPSPPSQPPPPPAGHLPPSLATEELQADDFNAAQAHLFNNCSYMHFDSYMDYQTTGFGGLPDVTEHSNIRRTLSRQNSVSNSDSGGEIASIQKSKVNFSNDGKSASTSGTNNPKRKAKASQQGAATTARNRKRRRSSCILALALVAAVCLLAVAATLAYQHFLMAPSRNSQAQRLRIVRRILREVPLVDGHNNFAWNVRKYAHSSLELVHLSHDLDHKSVWSRPVWAQTDMERLKLGLVGVQVWSAFVACEAQGLDAVQLALEQIDIIRRLTDLYADETTLVMSSKDIVAARRRGLMASMIGIEGGHAIGSSLGVLRSFYSLGARYLSLTHKCDVTWASSSTSTLESGLTQFGKAIIREMNRLGMMIDLSYSSDATARDVLQVTRAPVIFSHSAARQLCNSTRNIPDDILRLVAENGGLIMISFDSEDVACGRQSRLQDVVEHIKYIRAIAGIQHIGLGAGYDGIELPPVGLEDVSKYPDLLATLLEDPNWTEEDIAMLAGKNFLRIMETVENVRDYWKRAAIQPIEQTEPLPKSQCTWMSS